MIWQKTTFVIFCFCMVTGQGKKICTSTKTCQNDNMIHFNVKYYKYFCLLYVLYVSRKCQKNDHLGETWAVDVEIVHCIV